MSKNGSTVEKPTKSWGRKLECLWGPWTFHRPDGSLWLDVVRSEYANGKKTYLPYPCIARSMGGVADEIEKAESFIPAGPRYPYDIHEFEDAEIIFLPEGEKCMEILNQKFRHNPEIVTDRLGTDKWLVSCIQGGAKAWRREYAKFFVNKIVIIVPDMDPYGMHFARDATRDLLDLVSALFILWLPVKRGEDLEEFFLRFASDELERSIYQNERSVFMTCPAHFKNPSGLEGFFDVLKIHTAVTDAEELDAKLAETVQLTCLADVEPELIDWLWQGRFARGKLALISAAPDSTKSALTLWIAARVSKGERWPNNEGRPEIGSTLLLSAEDDMADTIRPRFAAAGGDATKVHGLLMVRDGDKDRPFSLVNDLPVLRRVGKSIPDLALIVIDPLNAYLGTHDKIDTWRDSDIRSVLAPLAALAAELNVAVIIVCHNTKGRQDGALNKVMGSVGVGAACRTASMVMRDEDEDDRRKLFPIKGNITKPVKGLAYRVIDAPTGFAAVPTSFTIKFEDGSLDETADEALHAAAKAGDGRASAELKACGDMLVQLVEEAGGSILVKDATETLKAHGYTPKQIRVAREKAAIKPTRADQGKAPWTWSLL